MKGGGHRKGCWSWTALVDDGAGCNWLVGDGVSSSLRKATNFERVHKLCHSKCKSLIQNKRSK